MGSRHLPSLHVTTIPPSCLLHRLPGGRVPARSLVRRCAAGSLPVPAPRLAWSCPVRATREGERPSVERPSMSRGIWQRAGNCVDLWAMQDCSPADVCSRLRSGVVLVAAAQLLHRASGGQGAALDPPGPAALDPHAVPPAARAERAELHCETRSPRPGPTPLTRARLGGCLRR